MAREARARADFETATTRRGDPTSGWPAGLQEHILAMHAAVRGSQLALPGCSSGAGAQVHLAVPDHELGYELFQWVPKAYALCRAGRLAGLTVCPGRAPFYYFVPRELLSEHSACNASFGHERDQNARAQHDPATARQAYPPYRRVFAWGRSPPRYTYAYNKRNGEWGGAPVNTYRAQHVARLCDLPARCGTVLFFRSRNDPSAGTGSRQWGEDDIDAARGCGLGLVSDWLRAAAPTAGGRRAAAVALELSNVAQLVLMSSAALTIGVQGGMGVLNGLVGGRSIVLCTRGAECPRAGARGGDYAWYPRIANWSIAVAASADDAIALAEWECGRTPVAVANRRLRPSPAKL